MPKFVVAHKSGAHRLAAIALYRALISQCKKLDISPQRGDELCNLIRYRFNGFRHTTSHRELKLLFEAGYEAIDRLDAAVAGNHENKQYVLELLQKVPQPAKKGSPVTRSRISEESDDPFQAKREDVSKLAGTAIGGHVHPNNNGNSTVNMIVNTSDRRPSGSGSQLAQLRYGGADHSQARESEVSEKDMTQPANDASSTLDEPLNPAIRKFHFYSNTFRIVAASPSFRKLSLEAGGDGNRKTSILEHAVPHEKLGGSGQRHVPKIFSANSIPVLRMKKPQPLALSAYLNSRIKQRQKRHDLRHALQAQLPIATMEDQWDDLLMGLVRSSARGSDRSPHSGITNREPRWSSEVKSSLKEVNSYLDQEKTKNRAMAEKMYAVIDREQKMANEERKEYKLRGREVAKGLEGLSEMVGDIIRTDQSASAG